MANDKKICLSQLQKTIKTTIATPKINRIKITQPTKITPWIAIKTSSTTKLFWILLFRCQYLSKSNLKQHRWRKITQPTKITSTPPLATNITPTFKQHWWRRIKMMMMMMLFMIFVILFLWFIYVYTLNFYFFFLSNLMPG